jgi:hypothetical protein
MYIFAIDPGKTTGWAFAQVENGEVTALTYGEDDFDAICARLDYWLQSYQTYDTRVVAEKYTITARTAQLSQQSWSLEVIGVARYLAKKHGDLQLIIQPTNVKKFATDKRLKALGWWHKGGGGHANDALRHLMGYLVSIGWMDDRIAT